MKSYYFFDEAGDPNVLGRRGVNLVEKGMASKYFMVGFLATNEPKEFSKSLENLRKELCGNDYLREIPSMKRTGKMFHATDDCPEVRQRVFELLRERDFEFHCVVVRKNADAFREKFDLKSSQLYEFLVSKLLENQLRSRDEIDCYFSSMGNVVRTQNMENAICRAIENFDEKCHLKPEDCFRVFVQQASALTLLQAADYLLWAIFRAYEHRDFRYYNFLKTKIYSVQEVDFSNDSEILYTPKNPIEKTKIDSNQG